MQVRGRADVLQGGQVSLQRGQQRVTSTPVHRPHAPEVPIILADTDEVGERERSMAGEPTQPGR
jgi:hypothetical protein